MTPFYETKLDLPKVKDFIADAMKQYGLTRAQAKEQYNQLKADKIFVNDTYQVNISTQPPWNEMGTPMLHISIKRLDKGHAKDWRDFQQIKNELVGPEYEAFELYPLESRLVDAANQFHLWCFATEGISLPIGFPARAVEGVPPEGSNVVQRPIEEEPEEVTVDKILEEGPQEITIDQIMEVAAAMDGAEVPQEGRIIELQDPETGEYVSSETDPDRVREIIQKYVDSEQVGAGNDD